MAKSNWKLVEIAPTDIHPGRVVVAVRADNSEVSFPVLRMKDKRMALVPAYMMEVFLEAFKL
jgi:hypothetical protein